MKKEKKRKERRRRKRKGQRSNENEKKKNINNGNNNKSNKFLLKKKNQTKTKKADQSFTFPVKRPSAKGNAGRSTDFPIVHISSETLPGAHSSQPEILFHEIMHIYLCLQAKQTFF